MTKILQIPGMILALVASTVTADAQAISVEDLVRAGEVRFAVFPPQYTKDSTTGDPRGWPVYLGGALAARLGVKALAIEYPGPREAMEGLKTGLCDVAFLPIEPSWAAAVDFSFPFMQLDFTLLVPAGSSIRSVTDADQANVRIAVVDKHASTLALKRVVKQAEVVSVETPNAAFELVRDGRADALASVRPALLEFSTRLPGAYVLEQRYWANFLTMAVAKGQAGRLAYFNEFIEEAKASGLVQQAIDQAGWRGVRVAPAGNSN
jgi:polar amino acid transport system substrate-binding protein